MPNIIDAQGNHFGANGGKARIAKPTPNDDVSALQEPTLKDFYDGLTSAKAQAASQAAIAKFLRGQIGAYNQQLLKSDAKRFGGEVKGFNRLIDSKSNNLRTLFTERDRARKYAEAAPGLKKPKGIKKLALGALGAAGAGIEQITMQPYYASKQAQINGSNALDQARTFGAGLPGLGGLASKKGRKAIEATNSQAERTALTQRHRLASFGQFMSGEAQSKLTGLSPEERARTHNSVLPGAGENPAGFLGQKLGITQHDVSIAGDVGLQTLGDPLNTVIAGAGEFGKIGEGLSKTRRAEVLLNPTGKGLIDAATRAAVEHGDIKALQKAIPDLRGAIAEEVLKAADTGGEEAARRALTKAFVDGTWNPTVRLRNQAAMLAGLTDNPGVQAVRNGGLNDIKGGIGRAVRSVARGNGVEALVTGSENVSRVLASTLDAAVARAKTTLPDYYAERVAPEIVGMSPLVRANRLFKIAAESDNPAFQDIARQFKGDIIKNGTDIAADPNLVARLTQLETAASLLTHENKLVAKQTEVGLNQGLKAKNRTADELLQQARKNLGGKTRAGLGLSSPSLLVDLPTDPEALLITMRARISTKIESEELRTKLISGLEDAASAGDKDLAKYAAQVEDTLAKPRLLGEAERLAKSEAERIAGALPNATRPGTVRRAVGEALLASSEAVPPRTIKFEGGPNPDLNIAARVDGADRWMSALGLDDFTRGQLRRRFELVNSEEQLFQSVKDSLTIIARRDGVDPEALHEILNANRQAIRERQKFAVQTLAHRIEDIPLPDPADIRQTVTDLLAQQGHTGAQIKAGLGKTLRAPLQGGRKTQMLVGAAGGALLAPGDLNDRLKGAAIGATAGAVGFENIHTLWKFAVVTNAPAIVAGAVAGGMGAFGNDHNPLKGALIGGGIGLLAPTRYLVRVAGIEEKMRTYMSAGFKPEEFIPFVSKWSRQHGVEELPFLSTEAVRSGSALGPHVSHQFLSTIADDWVEVPLKGGKGLDAWWRVANYQIHVESDTLADIFVRERAGIIGREEADNAAAEFLATKDGKIALGRLKAGVGGPKNAVEAITSYRSFIEEHLDADLAARRLEGEVDRDVLKKARTAGFGPEVIAAQKTWIVPKTASELFLTANQMASKVILSGPTSKFNRIPMAEHLYNREVTRLLNDGVEPKLAQRLADEFAVERTNRVMFQIEDESRFAKKIDFLFPFQQPREELLRVWGALVMRNPFKAAKIGRVAAVAFNNGVQSGMFRKDDFSGDYVMTVPGSAWLSDVLFNTNANFDFRLKDLLFVGQGAYNVGIVPSPGGPFWGVASKLYFDHNPNAYNDLKDRFPVLHELMFPYSPTGKLLRNEPNRLWMAFTGSTPPWEFAAGQAQDQELRKWTREIALQLRADHFAKTGDADWWPSETDLKDATSHFLQAWSFFGSVFPASARPILPGRTEADAIRDAYTKDGVFDYFRAIKDNPAFEPFFSSTKEYVGPNDYKHWSDVDELSADSFINGYFQQRTWQDLKKQIEENRKKAAAFEERRNIIATPDKVERERLMQQWRAKFPQYKDLSRNNYLRDTELHDILTTYPKRLQDEALNRWRLHYDVSGGSYKYIRDRVLRDYKSNPWAGARDGTDIVAAVKRATQNGAISDDSVVSLLAPAEQVRFWQEKRAELDYYQGVDDPKSILDRFKMFKAKERAVYAGHPELTKSTKQLTPMEQAIEKWQGDASKQMSAGYAEAARIKDAMNKAAETKHWSTYFALKPKRDAIFKQIEAIKTAQFKGFPALKANMDDFRALYVHIGDHVNADEWEAFQQTTSQKVGFRFVASWEDQNYLSMPDPVRSAYVQDLLGKLQTPSGTKGKVFWEWLTDFQRTILENNLPAGAVESFKRDHPSKGGSGSGGGRKSSGVASLDYAYSLFDQYNKRPKGQKAPASYTAFLKLPDNPIVRADFLKNHQDAAAWIKLGPMANMPEMLRYLVSNIMIQNGKWDGELKTPQEITDLSFAREQLKRWSLRGDATAPANYDTWVNMPTGVAKAQYLKAHPEIANWIKLGPMVNMPDEYQDVVRDIMQRYGEWTTKQDPLGKTITDFYATPTYARDAFMKDHPELLEYWSATRSDAENQMFALSDRYFSMQDQASKKMFLASHPELQQWFIDQRTKRYEKFLNRVAQYMGQNPELFKHYLDRQNEILAELLRQYATSPTVREVPYLSDAAAKASSTSEGSRKRHAAA